MKSAFVIAAASSGSGKTTLTLGLLRALLRRGTAVQAFKCGPDYIDTQFHAEATHGRSVNLDMFMSDATHVRDLFNRYSAKAEVNVVEGVMGLFDGYDRMRGSTAEVASVLDLPVVLVVNAASTAYSVAATIHGFSTFRGDVKIAGVIFNRVASERHYTFLREACRDAGTRCFGYILRDEALATPSRHLGLTLTARAAMDSFIDRAADAVAQTVDIDALLEATREKMPATIADNIPPRRQQPVLNVAVAHDEAFNFIYHANIDALAHHKRYRCHIAEFSPLSDPALPPDTDLLYLPGGYPELYAEILCGNHRLREEIRNYADGGGRILAECGGMIYLCSDIDGAEMCGVLPMHCTMEGSRLSLGYRTVTVNGLIFKGHEFHYSKLTQPDAMASAATLTDARGRNVSTPLYRHKNVFAGYTHLYWADTDILKLWNL